MPSIRLPGHVARTADLTARAGLLLGACLVCLLAGCGNKGDLYLPGSEADERSLRSIDELLNDLEREEDDDASTTQRKTPNGVTDPDAASS